MEISDLCKYDKNKPKRETYYGQLLKRWNKNKLLKQMKKWELLFNKNAGKIAIIYFAI